MNYKYQFFLNEQKDEAGRNIGPLGYKKGYRLELGYTGEVGADSDLAACDIVLEIFRSSIPADFQNRSMYPGDVIVLDNRERHTLRAYTLESFSFKEPQSGYVESIGNFKEIAHPVLEEAITHLIEAVNTVYPDGCPEAVEAFIGPATKHLKTLGQPSLS